MLKAAVADPEVIERSIQPPGAITPYSDVSEHAGSAQKLMLRLLDSDPLFP
jgi:hypothetical protein